LKGIFFFPQKKFFFWQKIKIPNSLLGRNQLFFPKKFG